MIVTHAPDKIELQFATILVSVFGILVRSSSGVIGKLDIAALPSLTELETHSCGVVYRLAYEHGVELLGEFEMERGTINLSLRMFKMFWWDSAGNGCVLNLRWSQIQRLDELDGKALESYVRRLARSVKLHPRNEALET